MNEPIRQIVNRDSLPEEFPTNMHKPIFWESLGRVVATFGFLEETLSKAIFLFTATKEYDNDKEVQQAYDEWLPKLEKALTDQLWNLTESYGKAVREHPDSTITNLDELLEQLKEASKIRNVICHGSWRAPDSNGASIPFFINRKLERFETPIDVKYLNQVQRHSIGLICAVINTVTHMGWQFPGSNGPSKVVWSDEQ